MTESAATETVDTKTGEIVREGFGSTEIATQHETAATASAAHAKALVESRYIVALNRPRNIMVARDKILADCKRPRFADAAIYQKPVGGRSIEGLSIRFVESALRHFGNVDVDQQVLYDDGEKRKVKVTVTDLESNTSYSDEIIVPKTIERKNLKKNQKAISQRLNSYNQVVYLVPGTDDDIQNKQNAMKSKSIRNSGLRILPADVLEEAEEICRKTILDRAAKDPDREKKKLLDAFSELGIKPDDLVKYLDHDLEKLVPAEIVELRGVYQALKDREVTWAQVMESKGQEPGSETSKDVKDVKAKLKEKKAARAKKGAEEAKSEETLKSDGDGQGELA